MEENINRDWDVRLSTAFRRWPCWRDALRDPLNVCASGAGLDSNSEPSVFREIPLLPWTNSSTIFNHERDEIHEINFIV
jgi:hypothetical protein